MKMCLFIVLILAGICQTEAQECKYRTNKVSGMDGSRLIITNAYPLSGNFHQGKLEVWSTLRGDTSVVVAFILTNEQFLTVSKGDSIQLTLENAEVVSVPVIQDASTVTGEEKQITIMTCLDKLSMTMLESSPVKQIVIYLAAGKLEGSPGNKKQAASVKRVIGCVKMYLLNTSK